jgi:hypothetical protein
MKFIVSIVRKSEYILSREPLVKRASFYHVPSNDFASYEKEHLDGVCDSISGAQFTVIQLIDKSKGHIIVDNLLLNGSMSTVIVENRFPFVLRKVQTKEMWNIRFFDSTSLSVYFFWSLRAYLYYLP